MLLHVCGTTRSCKAPSGSARRHASTARGVRCKQLNLPPAFFSVLSLRLDDFLPLKHIPSGAYLSNSSDTLRSIQYTTVFIPFFTKMDNHHLQVFLKSGHSFLIAS